MTPVIGAAPCFNWVDQTDSQQVNLFAGWCLVIVIVPNKWKRVGNSHSPNERLCLFRRLRRIKTYDSKGAPSRQDPGHRCRGSGFNHCHLSNPGLSLGCSGRKVRVGKRQTPPVTLQQQSKSWSNQWATSLQGFHISTPKGNSFSESATDR